MATRRIRRPSGKTSTNWTGAPPYGGVATPRSIRPDPVPWPIRLVTRIRVSISVSALPTPRRSASAEKTSALGRASQRGSMTGRTSWRVIGPYDFAMSYCSRNVVAGSTTSANLAVSVWTCSKTTVKRFSRWSPWSTRF